MVTNILQLVVGSGLRRVILVYAEPLKFYFFKLMRYVFCRWLAYSNIRDLIFLHAKYVVVLGSEAGSGLRYNIN